jgi:RHS repeat-associated protein
MFHTTYDGDGRRVKKAKASETLIFVYNVSGQLVAEYTTSTTENNGTSYLTSDTLGSPRVITKADGSVRARHDYLPFGEELYAGVGNRTATPGQGYDVGSSPADKTRQKFTSKERDIETGLDYFGARNYGSTIGRFTSADPLLTSGRPSNPQTWNRYSYTLGNPLKYVDPLGLFEWDASLRDDPNLSDKERKRRGQFRDAFIKARDKARADAAKAHDAGKLSDAKFKAINDALNAYGPDPGQAGSNNGVTVGVGTDNGESGSTDPTFAINEQWNAVTPIIAVKFDEGFLKSGSASVGVAHEGAHVEDALAYVAAYSEITPENVLTHHRNMMQWDTENHAFHVQSYLFEAMGKNDDRWGTWKTKWAKLDAQQQEGMRQEASTKIIRDAYKWTPDNKGWAFSIRACRPCN